MRALRTLLFCIGVAALSATLKAQTGLGVVRGTVQDASKAVIPNAKVTLSDTATGLARNSDTNAAGIFYFGGVPIGPYTLVVESSGFKKWEGTLTVQAGQTLVIDPALEIGSLENTVEVTGAAPVVTTQGAQVSDTKDALRIHNLPLNGRQITNLFDLTPGVEGGGNPRTNGMKVGSTEMLFDGISYVDRYGGGISRVQPGLDTIQEFRIETAGSGAQFSRPATVEMVTRSGTNEIHGALFETFRNNADGLRARQRQDGNTSAKLIRNEYGGWAGGPVWLPKIYNGRNKTFWFVDWEGLKQRQDQFAIAGVPTAAMWNGNLSNMTDSSGDAFTVYDPLTTRADGTRTPFAGNIIPSARISAFAKSMQSLVTPVPSGLNAGFNPYLGPNFQTYYSQPDDQHTFTIKGDQVFSEKDTVSAKFTRAVDANSLAGGRYGFPPTSCTNCGGSGRQNSDVFSTYVRWNHVFKPTLLNELQLSGHRSNNSTGTLGDNVNWANKLGLPNPFGVTGWPTLCTADYSLMYYGCWDGDNRDEQHLTAFQIDDNVTWIKGKHTVKFGFKGRQEYNNIGDWQQQEGSHYWGNDWTGQFDPQAKQQLSFTGSGFGTMLLGIPSYLSDQYNRGYFYFREKELGLYFNDTFKVTQRLTIDYGLRWDAWTPYNEKYDRLVNLDIKNYPGMMVITPHNTTMESIPGIPPAVLESWKLRGLTWETADQAHFPGALVPPNWKDFGPRFSVAYKLSDKWVIRGGFGMYYWPMPLAQILASSRTNPPLNLRFQTDYSNLNGAVPFYSISHVPGPNDYIGKAIVDIEHPSNSISSSAQAFMPFDIHHWADDTMMNWTITIEREIMKNTGLRLSYIGAHGYNLEQRWRWNDPESQWNYQARTGLATSGDQAATDARRVNPNWDSGCCQAPIQHNGFLNSSSIQANIERRFSNGLAFQWFYTYIHAMTTNDTGGFDYGGSSVNSTGSRGYAVPETILILGEPSLTDSQRLHFGYTNSSLVPPHRFRWNGIYELPFGRGKRFASGVSKAMNQAVGGWQLAFIGTWQSGNWSNVSNSEYLFGNPVLSPDQRLTMNIFGRNQELWFRGDFDPTQATNVDLAKLEALVPVDRAQRMLRPLGPGFDNRLPEKLADGTIRLTTISDMLSWNPRNFFLGPHSWNEDLSIFKYFDITEKMKMRFTADFFNVFNHPNNLLPNATTGLQDLSQQTNAPRIIQFSLRLEW